jgi:sialate O-acetylesterase
MKISRACFFLICAAGCGGRLRADVTLAPLFTDHAVLQCDKPLPVWGRARPGEAVTVAFRGQRVAARAGNDGRWIAFLPPFAASCDGADFVVTGKNAITLHDVVIGEVWLCSGQSNMEFLVHGKNLYVLNADQEVAAAQYPLIRHFKVKLTASGVPVDATTGSWIPCSPATVGQFTAVGYFFAQEIFRKLRVPVGLINSSWGGTRVEAWMSPDAIEKDPAFDGVWRRWRQTVAEYPQRQAAYEAAVPAWNQAEAAATAAGKARLAAFLDSNPKPYPPSGPGSAAAPSSLFNGMINPLIPYALRGVIWYQGEANTGRAYEYHRLFAAMITGWRAHFGQGDFPFYWVQLANFDFPGDPTHQTWAFLREAQTQTLTLPSTGQAVTIDIGDPANTHPRNKQEVGRRLALIAKARAYGVPGDFSGPVFASATREGAALRVTFRYAENGLTAAGKPLQSFEIAGADRQFHPASAAIAGDTLLVGSPQVPAPVAVRYAWRNAPDANLYNGAGLPAVPFRSDSW